MRRYLALLFFLLGPALSGHALAQSYPAKPIRLVVPFAPGGSADAVARPLAQKLGDALGQSVVVENKAGGLTVIGADSVAKSAPDGYTLYVMPGTHVLLPLLVQRVPFNTMDDFTPIGTIGAFGYFFLSHPTQPFASMKALIDHARANPGKLSIGVSDIVTRVAAEAFLAGAKVEMTVVNYKGGGPLTNDLVGGHVAVGIASPLVLPFVKDKRLNALAYSSTARYASSPDVPTVAEAAAIPGYDMQSWYAIAGPAGLPPAIIETLRKAMEKAVADPDLKRHMLDAGVEAAADTSPAAARATMISYQGRMGKLIQAAGIKPE